MARDVSCKVENCQYWEQGHRCTAGAIEVSVDGGGQRAGRSDETNCHTFASRGTTGG